MFNRDKFYEIIDEIDKIIEYIERDIEKMLKMSCESGLDNLIKPVIYGFSMKVEPDGEPVLNLFGDRNILDQGFREPFYDQILDKERGVLRLIVELPGVDKNDISFQLLEEEALIEAVHKDRKYRLNTKFKAPINPNSSSVSYFNGVLEATFKLRDKTNKSYTKIEIQ